MSIDGTQLHLSIEGNPNEEGFCRAVGSRIIQVFSRTQQKMVEALVGTINPKQEEVFVQYDGGDERIAQKIITYDKVREWNPNIKLP